MKQRPRVAAGLERVLRERREITSVRVNAVTGRVLVVFEVERGPHFVGRVLREALERVRTMDLPRGGVAHGRPAAFERLLRYARPYHRALAKATAFSVADKVLDLVPPLLIGAAVEVAAKRRGIPLLARLGFATTRSQLLVLGATSVAAWGLESLTGYMHRLLWQSIAQAVQHDLRLDAYAHVQRLDADTFEERRVGELTAVLTEDVNRLQLFLNDDANHLIQVVTNAVLLGAAFFVMAPAVAPFAVLPLPFVVWLSVRRQRATQPFYREAARRAGRVSSHVADSLIGMTTVKSFTAEEHEVAHVRRLSRSYAGASRPVIAQSAAFEPVVRLPILFGFVGTLLVGGMLVAANRMQPGTYAAAVFLSQRFLWPLTSLGRTVETYQLVLASVERVLDVLDIPPGDPDRGEPLDADGVRGEIAFADVSFAYGDGPPVLRHLDLRIAAGRTVGIVGHTGSGKSTLVKLLLRFREAGSGAVLLDGRDVRLLRARDVRRAIGLVNQDLYLVDGTVRENIAYGDPGAPFEAVVRAARLAEAHDFIMREPLGYDTPVGERGIKLSTGQRQRICIARAIVKDPPIFVFDEATSAVDNETEAAIQRSLSRISAGRTTIVIAHRLSTLRGADTIYVLGQHGSVVEQGTHDELVQLGGTYASLWRVQCGPGIPPAPIPEAFP